MEVKDVILTEYDEALHVENEKRLSFEQGVAQGLEQGIKALIQDNLEEKISPQRILEKLMDRFGLSEKEAEERLRRYSN